VAFEWAKYLCVYRQKQGLHEIAIKSPGPKGILCMKYSGTVG